MNGWTSRGTRGTTNVRWSLCLLVGLMTLSVGVCAADDKEDYTKYPGYVDFKGLGHFDAEEALVEIDLRNALLLMVSKMTQGVDPELADVLSKLKLVRVQKFALDEREVKDVEAKVDGMARKLEKDGWMRVVRVREEVDNVHVYFLLADEKLHGITVMAIENWETAAFVNIVGEIDPEQIGRLGAKFNIDELHDLHWDWEDQGRRRERRDRDRDRDGR